MTSPDFLGQVSPQHSPTWMEQAACTAVDPRTFYPEGRPEIAANLTFTALATCDLCPVQAECLDHALSHDERYGIWGGTTESERARMKHRRRA